MNGGSFVSIHKDEERKTWYVCVRYTDWQGDRRMKKKRGFATQREAKEWEREFLRTPSRSCDMTFESMVSIYLEDMGHRLKAYTMRTKRNYINASILPFFGKLKMNEITPAHVRKWHNQMAEKGLAPTTERSIHAQLSAIFNYACKFYNLPDNPVRQAGSIGSEKPEGEMKFWTPEEFERFISHVEKKPARMAFMTLFWSGLRIGELLALCQEDLDLDKGIIHVRKSIQIIDKREVITEPKTAKSKRDVRIPKKLCDQLKEYMASIYGLQPGDRIFPQTKEYLYDAMSKGSAAAGLEKIRLHDLRHSYASMLINEGAKLLFVSNQLGHESPETTLNIYSHLYQESADEAVDLLEKAMK